MSDMPARAPARIVIPIVAGIGNALMATPMIRAIKRAFPECRITILARIEAMAEVFRRMPEVDETLVTGKGVAGVMEMIREARRRKADVYLVPFPSNRWQYSLLALTSRAKRKLLHSYPVGYWRSLQFIGERLAATRGIHDVQQNLSLLKLLGVDEVAQAPTFAISDEDRSAASALLEAARIPDDAGAIAVHAGSAQTVLAQAKRWPAESYGQLVDRLQEELGQRVILLEGPDERGVAGEILSQVKSRAPMVAQLGGSLGVAAAVLERARLYVGSDSGLAHLAAAVGTPAVTLFAAADPDRVSPFGYRDLVVQAPTPCAPCFKYPWEAPHPKICCTQPYCIGQITVDSVLAQVRRALTLKQTRNIELPVAAGNPA